MKFTLKQAKAMKKELVKELNIMGYLIGCDHSDYIKREVLLKKITEALESQ